MPKKESYFLHSSMKPDDIKTVRERMGWNRKQAAHEIGVSPTQLVFMENGARSGGTKAPVRIPKLVAWACAAALAGLRPYGERPAPPQLQAQDPFNINPEE